MKVSTVGNYWSDLSRRHIKTLHLKKVKKSNCYHFSLLIGLDGLSRVYALDGKLKYITRLCKKGKCIEWLEVICKNSQLLTHIKETNILPFY